MTAPAYVLHANRVLQERDEAVQDALAERDWWERKPKGCELDCGCSGAIETVADAGGMWQEWRWAEQCELHEAAERIVKGVIRGHYH